MENETSNQQLPKNLRVGSKVTYKAKFPNRVFVVERKNPFMIRDPTSEDRLAIVVSPVNYGKIGKKNK